MKNQNLLVFILIHAASSLVDSTSDSLQSLINESEAKGSQLVHSRKRRYVVFPEGSTFTMAFCISLKALTGPDLIFTEGVNWAISYDLPNETIHDKETNKLEFPIIVRRHKRDLFKRMELLINSAGIDGESCVLHALCETSRMILPRQGILEEMIRILFTYPGQSTGRDVRSRQHQAYVEAYQRGVKKENCNQVYPCPISIVQLALGFGTFQEPDSNNINF